VFGNTDVTVAELWQDFESMFRGLVASGERGSRTLDRYETQYRSHIEPHFGTKRVQKVSPQQISAWLAQLRASSLTDVASIYAVLSTLMNFALERGLISKSPCAGISKRERPKQTQKNPPRRIGDDEVSSLLKHALPVTRDSPPSTPSSASGRARARDRLGRHRPGRGHGARAPAAGAQEARRPAARGPRISSSRPSRAARCTTGTSRETWGRPLTAPASTGRAQARRQAPEERA
jgi:hypothetical protein